MGKPTCATRPRRRRPPDTNQPTTDALAVRTPCSSDDDVKPAIEEDAEPPVPVEKEPTDAPRASRRRKPHCPESWETVKDEIARLYLEENRRLKDVMAIMEEKHGFWASSKMYKTKLTQWKFFKNNRQTDVANLLYLQRHRLALGKESDFRRNGRTVDVSTYMRRKGLSPIDLLETAQSGDLPPTLRVRTPPLSPLLKPIDAPDDLVVQESYMQWSTGTVLLPAQMDSAYFKSLARYHQSHAMQSVILLVHGCWLFSIGKMQEGGAFCRRAFTNIHALLDVSSHFAVYELMGAAARYPDSGILRELWSYLTKFAKTRGVASEQMRRMLAAFGKLSRDHALDHNVEMLQWGRRQASIHAHGTFDGKPFDYTLLRPWDILPLDAYFHRYYMSQEQWTPDDIMTATMYGLEAFNWSLRADLLLIFGNQTQWTDDRVSAMALKMLQGASSEEHPPQYLLFVCFYALAYCNRARCQGERARSSPDHKLARQYLSQAAEVQRETWPAGKNYYETLTVLEKWYDEAGEEDAAEATRARRDVECERAFKELHL